MDQLNQETYSGILGLTRWPFDLTPDMWQGSLTWADRSDVKTDVDRLLFRATRHPANKLQFLWANFGAGKAHTLLYKV